VKYIIVKQGSVRYGILFPVGLSHRDVARVCRGVERTIVSAGFCERNDSGEWRCWGESTSLGIGTMPDDDEVIDESFPGEEVGSVYHP
jgi:hypothetical protein